ncbi:MAG: carbohydrate ABC transporter permease [Anaerolineae bacterium]
MPKRRLRIDLGRIVVHIVLITITLAFLFPLLWMFSTSVKTQAEYFTYPPVWIPAHPTLEHYRYIVSTTGLNAVRNSLIVASVNVALVMAVSIPAAYAIARFRIGGHDFSFWVLSQRMLAPIAVILPLFLLFSQLKLVDTHPALILGYTSFNVAFAVWLLIGFFEEFPTEIEDAGLVDGCSRWGVLFRVTLPIVTPGLVVTALFCFVFAWNEFLFALILTRQFAATIPVQLAAFQAPTKILWGEMSAFATVGILPPLVFAFLLQRYLVRGLAVGGIR